MPAKMMSFFHLPAVKKDIIFDYSYFVKALVPCAHAFLEPNLTFLFFSNLNLKTPSIRQAFCVDMSGIDIDK